MVRKFERSFLRIRQTIGNMYYAGTETAIQWSGYIDGAISSGERAAREILYAMAKLTKQEIWQKEPPNKV